VTTIATRLAETLGRDRVLTDADEIAPWLSDWRGLYRGQAQAVVRPRTVAEVSRCLALCNETGTPVVPRGGNTGLCGGATPDGEGRSVVLSLDRMNTIRSLDTVGNTIVAEAGCILGNLRRAAQEAGRLLPLSLGAEDSCQIGGNLAPNAGGVNVVRFGMTRELVLGIEAVLPSGDIFHGLRTLRKDNTGYALKHLFIGAEGTLGIVTAVALRLHPKPAVTASAWLALESVDDALHCLTQLQQSAGDRICAYELLNRAQLQAVVSQFPSVRLPVDPEAPYAVLLELSDTYARADLAALLEDTLGALSGAGRLRDAAIAANEGQRASFWQIRHAITEANRKTGMGLTSDVAVPVKAVPAFIEQASRAVQGRFPMADILLVAHMGDGNVHFIPRFGFDDWAAFPDQPAVAEQVRRLVHDEAVALGGTFSAEHGIGHVLVGEMRRLRPELELELMRGIRRAIDPGQSFNRGKLFAG
jgi:FAD/FMN-containing dehydrogenase